MITDIFKPNVESSPKGMLLPLSQAFNPAQTLDCGQAFRWEKLPDGSFSGIANKKFCRISQLDNSILLEDVSQTDYDIFWRDYFDMNRDYEAIKALLSTDPTLARAIEFAPGIRVLHQNSWEALCSFIISQNNNIPRIKGIISRLCELLGEKTEYGYTFPEPQKLAALSPEDLAPLRAGFRARYLIDAARKVSDGIVDLDLLTTMPLEDARILLKKIVGVGAKVAECTLLYGCGRVECFPIDVWIARAMDKLFPDGLPECAIPFAGIAQQFIFHYMRFGYHAIE